ncbi:MAG: DUF1214 domain-containing protein [Rhodomicrobium sp.]
MPFLSRFFIFVAIALTLGLGSAWRTVNHGFFAAANRYGPWVFWFREGTADADPYTIAHVARQGVLPVTAASEMVFTATRDSAGSHLSGNCTYEIRGYAVPALWWNIAAFKSDGEIMPSKTGRSGFSSANILSAPEGTFTVRLSPDVQPGNWIPATRGNRVILQLTVLRPLSPDNLLKAGGEILPEITLMECS